MNTKTEATTKGRRLLSLKQAAEFCGLSYWTIRDLAMNGHVPVVRLPSAKAESGTSRRVLIDVNDLERLIADCKEMVNADANQDGGSQRLRATIGTRNRRPSVGTVPKPVPMP
jgi:hypothetical protein